MDQDTLRKVDQFKLLTETGPDSLMGMLLRQFWHPIALCDEVASGKARAVRVLGEDLTLYRGASGTAYLVGGRCAHRCTVLHTGVVQDEQIRCMYHGWRYDGTGLCTEIPAEKQPRTQADQDRRLSRSRILRAGVCLSRRGARAGLRSAAQARAGGERPHRDRAQGRSGTATGFNRWRTRSMRCM